jgi:hypothetical protein
MEYILRADVREVPTTERIVLVGKPIGISLSQLPIEGRGTSSILVLVMLAVESIDKRLEGIVPVLGNLSVTLP